MDTSRVREIRANMERANARRLQPYFIASFFRDEFSHLGGKLRERESKRFEITHVPSDVRNRDRQIGTRNRVQRKYERITFDTLARERNKIAHQCPHVAIGLLVF